MRKNCSVNEFSRSFLEENFKEDSGIIGKAYYLNDYFEGLKKERKIKKISVIKEYKYIDKYYLRDYSRYYAEAFETLSSLSERLHFFACDLDDEKLEKILKTGKKELLLGTNQENEHNQNRYLGYVTVKPVKNIVNSKLIGRSSLVPYPRKQGNNTRYYLSSEDHCSLYGIDLKIDSIPFHEQDIAVGACASACLWMTQFVIKNWFNIPLHSLAEITELSRLKAPYTIPSPVFPSIGLTPAEIANYSEHLNLHFHFFGIEDLSDYAQSLNLTISQNVMDELLEDIIKAYFSAGFPIICGLRLYDHYDQNNRDEGYEGHAVLLTGFKKDRNGKIIRLYIHDDQIGPYCRTEFNSSKFDWKNQWTDLRQIEKIFLTRIIIPADPRVKLHFLLFFSHYYEDWKANAYNAELNLYHNSDYKRYLWPKKFLKKEKILSKNLPRYVWVVHLYENEEKKISRDIVFDANTTLLRDKLMEVHFS